MGACQRWLRRCHMNPQVIPQAYINQHLNNHLSEDNRYYFPDVFDPVLDRKVVRGPFLIELLDWMEISKPTAQENGIVDVDEEEELPDLPGLRQNQENNKTNQGGYGKRMLKFK